MSTTLSDTFSEPRIEDIDTELDDFNDHMNILGYDAVVRMGGWGERVIEVYADQAEPIEQFWGGMPGYLDDFRDYSHKTQDATSHARAVLEGANA
jgi:hypothetical protein